MQGFRRARRGLLVSNGSYIEQVLATAPFAYWPLAETGGTLARSLGGLASADATHSGVTLNAAAFKDNSPAPLFDGVNDQVTLPHSALDAALNRSTGSLALWVRAADATVWTEVSNRHPFAIASSDFVLRGLRLGANQLGVAFQRGAASRSFVVPLSTLEWFHVAVVWNNLITLYLDGTIPAGNGPTDISSGVAAQPLTTALLGAGLGTFWRGSVAHAALWNRALSASEIAALATV